MSERDVVTQLGSVADTPIKPPDTFSGALWHELEIELTPAVRSVTPHGSDARDANSDIAVAAPPSSGRRNPAWAAAAAFGLVLGAGVLAWWLFQAGHTDVVDTGPISGSFTVPGAVELAEGDVLWPVSDMNGTAESVAEAFAVEVLGWNQPVATQTDNGTCLTFPSRNTETCPANGITVAIEQDGVAPLEVVMNTIGENETGQLWAVAQVGSGYPTDRLEPTARGIRIPLTSVDNAVDGDITMRLAEDFRLVEISAGAEDLETGYVDTDLVPDPEPVLSILVRYRNSDGHVIGAAGGPWNIFYEWADEPKASGPEVTIADGTYEGSTAPWRMSAFNTTDGNLCIRLEGMGCVADIPATEHLGALLTTTGFEAGDGDRWCVYGPVKEAETVQIHLPDGTWNDIPIYANQNFDVDFYAHCGLGNQPATEVRALDTNGNVIDQVPGPDNG